MPDKSFEGDKKVGKSVLSIPEKAFVLWGAPKIPGFIETYHLTLMTLVWSILNPVFGYLARNNIHWLWLVSLMIFLQYITDVFDGEVGRRRRTGLIKWGFYMDHFLDYVFLCSLVLTGYLIAPEGLGFYFLVLLIITGGFIVNSYLGFAATNRFRIYYFGLGPTEMRLLFIIINTVIIFTGTDHFTYTVPLACGICLIALIVTVLHTGNVIWKIDMEKNN
jgi:phosphatidylglycerophosphate synthase